VVFDKAWASAVIVGCGRVLLPPLLHRRLPRRRIVGPMLVHERDLVARELVTRRQVLFQLRRSVRGSCNGGAWGWIPGLLLEMICDSSFALQQVALFAETGRTISDRVRRSCPDFVGVTGSSFPSVWPGSERTPSSRRSVRGMLLRHEWILRTRRIGSVQGLPGGRDG